jgi:thymidylate synthase
MRVNIIVAVGEETKDGKYPIGKGGKLPWHDADDLKFFKEITMGHPIIMGRKTFESIGKVLPGRINVVITSNPLALSAKIESGKESVFLVKTLEEALKCLEDAGHEDVFIIGGASLYEYALKEELVDRIYINYLNYEVNDADAFFSMPDIVKLNGVVPKQYDDILSQHKNSRVYDLTYGKMFDNVDKQYFGLLENIIANGVEKDTRAGKTKSVFGRMMRFDLQKGLPVLTTKKMFMKGCIHELLWFLQGGANIKYLVDNGVHIWDDDAFRFAKKELAERPGGEKFKDMTKEEFLEHVKNEDTWGSYQFGDLGPVYGKQWRSWGGYGNIQRGIDQVKNVIETLKTNPDDRRMIISAWNVGELNEMALPPCHYFCQFYTREMSYAERLQYAEGILGFKNLDENEMDKLGVPTRKLSCMWSQRSVDCGLGWSFNVLSYSILTHLIARCVHMVPDELIFSGGDCHIYLNQMDGIKEQLIRDPMRYSSPELILTPGITDIDKFTYDDIKIVGYHSYPTIKMPLSVG